MSPVSESADEKKANTHSESWLRHCARISDIQSDWLMKEREDTEIDTEVLDSPLLLIALFSYLNALIILCMLESLVDKIEAYVIR